MDAQQYSRSSITEACEADEEGNLLAKGNDYEVWPDDGKIWLKFPDETLTAYIYYDAGPKQNDDPETIFGGQGGEMKKPGVFLSKDGCNLAQKDKHCKPGCWAYASSHRQAQIVQRLIKQMV